MQLALPEFQFRFIPSMGNVIYPGNFHPVGTQRSMDLMVDRVLGQGSPQPGAGGRWLLVGGSGGFGSAARVVLGAGHGAHTLNLSLDAQPKPESTNKVRKIGSPGYHRNLAIERRLRALGLGARTIDGDAFSPEIREQVITAIKQDFGQLDGIVWALAAPRARDPRTDSVVTSALKPLGRKVSIKTFSGRDSKQDLGPRVDQIELEPGSPEEAIATIFVMGGGIVQQWVETLLAADALADGFKLLTISYRGSELNADVYREGLIGLAKADLEFQTKALDATLRARVGGRAVPVEGPAVVTEASGGIPGVPFYMALLMDVMGDAFEDPLGSMGRMFRERFDDGEPVVDEQGLLRMDDRELTPEVQAQMKQRFERYRVGDAFDEGAYERFMTAYAQTRGFEIPGVDYGAEFDTDEIIRS